MRPVEISISRKQLLRIPLKTDPVRAQGRVLKKLLRKASKTAFGRHHHFTEILTDDNLIEQFQKKVPLHDYNKIHSEWWHRTQNGEANVAWPGKVKYFALSSGTSQAGSKKIPVTKEMIRALKKGAFRVFTRLARFDDRGTVYTKSWLAIGGSARLIREDGHFIGYLSGINANIQPFWARMHYKPGETIARIIEWDERVRKISEKAPEWDISVLVGIPHWIQIVLEEIIRKYQLDTIQEIWPDCSLIVTGGVAFEPYRPTFEKLIGHRIQSLDTYLASEGLIAIQEEPGGYLQLLLSNDIFFEFIPFTEAYFDDNGDVRGHPEVLTIEDVEPGVDYALFISTPSGAWRYIIGDTIQFVNDDQRSIIISGRTKHYLNLATEHVTIDNLNAAIEMVQKKYGINIPEYTVAGIHQEHYIAHRWYVSPDKPIEKETLQEAIDQALKSVNDDYRAERETLLSMELEIIPVDIFYRWQSKHSSAAGQAKIPRVMKGQQLEEWLQFIRHFSDHKT